MRGEPLRKFLPELLHGISKFNLGVIATTATLVVLTVVSATLPLGIIPTVATVLAYICVALGALSIGRVQRWLRK